MRGLRSSQSWCFNDRWRGVGVVRGRVDVDDLFRVHQRSVFGYLLRVSGDRALAEDLAQEVFLRAFRSAPRFRGDASVRTWLFVIARSVLASHYRRRRLPALDDADADIAFHPDPAQRLGVEEALNALPGAAREVLVLVDLLGFEPIEAAEVIGITSNAVRVRLHRARSAFREVYAS